MVQTGGSRELDPRDQRSNAPSLHMLDKKTPDRNYVTSSEATRKFLDIQFGSRQNKLKSRRNHSENTGETAN